MIREEDTLAKSDRKYGVYGREVTTHNFGSWGRSLWKVVTLLLGVGPWVSGIGSWEEKLDIKRERAKTDAALEAASTTTCNLDDMSALQKARRWSSRFSVTVCEWQWRLVPYSDWLSEHNDSCFTFGFQIP